MCLRISRLSRCGLLYLTIACFFVTVTAAVANADSESRKCFVIPEYKSSRYIDDTMVPFWAQQATGADIVHNIFRRHLADTDRYPFIDVAVISSGILKTRIATKSDNVTVLREDLATEKLRLGTRLANLIFGKLPYSAGVRARLAIEAKIHNTAELNTFIETVLGSSIRLVYVSHAGLKTDRPEDVAMLRRLTDAGKILIIGADSNFPQQANEAIRETNGIVVGSLSPAGLPSAFTHHRDVDIFMPADHFTKSKGIAGTYRTVGGNDAAAAMVAGAAANIMSLLPDISQRELKELLQRSSLKVPHVKFDESNRAGMVNQYHAVNVAKILRDRDFLDRSSGKRWEMVSNQKRYLFGLQAEDANGPFDDFRDIGNDCDDRMRAAYELRRIFLIADNRAKMIEKLATTFIDKQGGKFKNTPANTTLIYRAVAEPLETYFKSRLDNLSWDSPDRVQNVYLFASRFGRGNRLQEWAEEFLQDSKRTEWSVMRSLSLGPNALDFIRERMRESSAFRHFFYLHAYWTSVGNSILPWQKDLPEMLERLRDDVPKDELPRFYQAMLGSFVTYPVENERDLEKQAELGRRFARWFTNDMRRADNAASAIEFRKLFRATNQALKNSKINQDSKVEMYSRLDEIGVPAPVDGIFDEFAVPRDDLDLFNRGQGLQNVDIRDLVKFRGSEHPFLQILLTDLRNNSGRYFPFGVEFRGVGPFNKYYARENAVYGVEIEGYPQSERRQFTVNLIAMYHSSLSGVRFRRVQVTVDNSQKQVVKIQPVEDFSISDTNFRVEVGIAQRKVLLIDDQKKITKVYPVAVGALDYGVRPVTHRQFMLMTPAFATSHFQPTKITSHRCDPNYYECKPFIRIMTLQKGATDIGFHIKQNPKLERGFVSHGCMRLREKDLYEMLAIFKRRNVDRAEVKMQYFIENRIDHPYPMLDDWHTRVRNDGDRYDPIPGKDEFDLTAIERVSGPANVQALRGYRPTAEDDREYLRSLQKNYVPRYRDYDDRERRGENDDDYYSDDLDRREGERRRRRGGRSFDEYDNDEKDDRNAIERFLDKIF